MTRKTCAWAKNLKSTKITVQRSKITKIKLKTRKIGVKYDQTTVLQKFKTEWFSSTFQFYSVPEFHGFITTSC